MPKKHSQELIAMAGQLYTELKSGHAVAKKLGLAYTTVYRLLHKSGVQVAEKWGEDISELRKKIKREQVPTVVKDYQDGMPNAQLMEKYGVGYYSIKTALKSAGVKLRDHGGQRRRIYEDEEAEIVRLYTEEHLTQQQIAVRIKGHQTVVSAILRQHGINRGSRKGAYVRLAKVT